MDSQEEEWKDRGRPQSVMAQQFSAMLDNTFGLDSTSERSQALEEKKKALTTQSAELQDLEARLKAMEARLQSSSTPKPKPAAGPSQSGNQPGSIQRKPAPPVQTPQARMAGPPGLQMQQNMPIGMRKPVQQQQPQQRPRALGSSESEEEDSDEEEEEEEDDSETEESSEEEEEDQAVAAAGARRERK